ncbi:MAG TPA: DNA methyltransferase, partial [Bacteroidota bacterium]
SAQRQASPIHEISYRACFKPQLPRFFIERYTNPGDIVYDPFMGRGTTVLEALLNGRKAVGNDVNPLSRILVAPRAHIPVLSDIQSRLAALRFNPRSRADIDLSMFYHPKTEAELVSLKRYFSKRCEEKSEDAVDGWIRMIATNRLTGHSPGFFSVYTLPPNQAAAPENQRKINRKLRQRPEYRNVKELILRKTIRILRSMDPGELAMLSARNPNLLLLVEDARTTKVIRAESVSLTVTSPPFLNIVNYSADNWLRCWFNEIPVEEVAGRITMAKTVAEWQAVMGMVFKELFRITKQGGYVAFEVGEIRRKTLRLDEVVLPLGERTGFTPVGVLINRQSFTKTSNIWGIRNNSAGTNTNRVVLFRK